MKKGWKVRMNVSASGFAFLKHYEGFRESAYKCPSGVWTIGYGHTQGVKEGDTITQLEAQNLLVRDVNNIYAKYVNDVLCDYGIYAEQCEFDMLVSFAFNCGCGAFKKVITSVRDEYYRAVSNVKMNEHETECFFDDRISRELVFYVYSGDRKLAGLVKRRNHEIDIFRGGWGDEGSLNGVTTYCQVLDGSVILTSPRGFKNQSATESANIFGVEPLGVSVREGYVAVRCKNGQSGWISRECIDTSDCQVVL